MSDLVQRFIVEGDVGKASPIMPARCVLVNPDGTPALPAKAKNPGAKATVAKLVDALVEVGLMEAPGGSTEAE